MLLRMAALSEGVIGIALKEELNCGYEVVLGPGTIRAYQCRRVHTSQRDHKPTTHKWMYYPHTSMEILFEILLRD